MVIRLPGPKGEDDASAASRRQRGKQRQAAGRRIRRRRSLQATDRASGSVRPPVGARRCLRRASDASVHSGVRSRATRERIGNPADSVERLGVGQVVRDQRHDPAVDRAASAAASSRPAAKLASWAQRLVRRFARAGGDLQYPAGALWTELWNRVGETSRSVVTRRVSRISWIVSADRRPTR